MKIGDFNFDFKSTKVFALGGLDAVGKNMYVVMHENEIIIIDAGVMFPGDTLPGIDYVLPDFTFLKKNQNKIKGLFITHGHLDHIGGIPYLLKEINIPVIYAPKIAGALIKERIKEKRIKYKNLIIYNEDTKVKFQKMSVEFFATTHSIPDSFGISITTPNGVIVDTGDFKFDFTPIGPIANLHKMAEIGKKGVKLLMSDSTNAMNEGFSISESKVDTALNDVFKKTNGRIILATFASNVYRLKHIIETCKANNRKVALFGRSMDTIIDIASKTGYIDTKDIIIKSNEVKKYKENEICLLCTGSQGEPLAALSRIANGSHRQIKLKPNDTVIFSSSPIPGNKVSIARTINQLHLKGATVFTNEQIGDIHTTGHANSDELKLMIQLLKPEYFMPVHGEHRMLQAHGKIAMECGIKKNKVFVCENGDVVEINKLTAKKAGHLLLDDIYVDGNRIGDVGNFIIKDRNIMADDGILIVVLNIDNESKQILKKPNVITRGFIHVNENIALIKKIENKIADITKNIKKQQNLNYSDIKNDIISGITPFIKSKTGRKPLILPVIMDIKR